MKPPRCRRKCLNCKELFLPDYRSGQRQRYCPKAGCRKASKRASQRAWLATPENQDYFRDAQNAERVRRWRKEHPDYWKNTTRHRGRTLQDGCPDQTPEQAPAAQEVTPIAPDRTLQYLCTMQTPLFVGLISMFVGSTLPEDIATSTRRLLIKGHDILGMVPGIKLERLLIVSSLKAGFCLEPRPRSIWPARRLLTRRRRLRNIANLFSLDGPAMSNGSKTDLALSQQGLHELELR